MNKLIEDLKKNPSDSVAVLAVTEKLDRYYRKKLIKSQDTNEKFKLNLNLTRLRESSTEKLMNGVDMSKLQSAADAFNIPDLYDENNVILLKERANAWYARRINPFGPFIDLEKMLLEVAAELKKCRGWGLGKACEEHSVLQEKSTLIEKCMSVRQETDKLDAKKKKKARKSWRDRFKKLCGERDKEYFGRLKGYILNSGSFRTFQKTYQGNANALRAVKDFFEKFFPAAVKIIDRGPRMGGERFDLQTDELSISKLVDLISLDGTFSNNDNAEFQEANNTMKEVVVVTNITSVFLTSIGEVMNIVSDKETKLAPAEGEEDSDSDDDFYIDPSVVYSTPDILKTPLEASKNDDSDDDFFIDPDIVDTVQKLIEKEVVEVSLPQRDISNKITAYIETAVPELEEEKEDDATQSYLDSIKNFYRDSASRLSNAVTSDISSNIKSATTELRISDALSAPGAILTTISDKVGATSPTDFILKIAGLLWSGPGKIYEGIAWICSQLKHLLGVVAAKMFGTMKLLLGSFTSMVIWPLKKILNFLRVPDKIINAIVGIVELIAPLFGFALASLVIWFAWPLFLVIGSSVAGILAPVFSTIASSLVGAIVGPFTSITTLFASAGPMMVGQQIATIIFGPAVAVVQMVAALITGGIGAGGLGGAITTLMSGKVLQGAWALVSTLYSWWTGQSQDWYGKLKSFLKPSWWIALQKIIGYAATVGSLAQAKNKNLKGLPQNQITTIQAIKKIRRTATKPLGRCSLMDKRTAKKIQKQWQLAIGAMEVSNKSKDPFHRLFKEELQGSESLFDSIVNDETFKAKMESYGLVMAPFPTLTKLIDRVGELAEIKALKAKENAAIKAQATVAANALPRPLPMSITNNAHFHMTHIPHVKLTMIEKIALMGYDSPLHFVAQHPMHPTHTYTCKWIEHPSTLHYRLH